MSKISGLFTNELFALGGTKRQRLGFSGRVVKKPTLNRLWGLFRPQTSVGPPYDKAVM